MKAHKPRSEAQRQRSRSRSRSQPRVKATDDEHPPQIITHKNSMDIVDNTTIGRTYTKPPPDSSYENHEADVKPPKRQAMHSAQSLRIEASQNVADGDHNLGSSNAALGRTMPPELTLRTRQSMDKFSRNPSTKLADRAKYQFEADSEEEAELAAIHIDLDAHIPAAKRLNGSIPAMGEEVSSQNRWIEQIAAKSDRLDDSFSLPVFDDVDKLLLEFTTMSEQEINAAKAGSGGVEMSTQRLSRIK